MKRKAKFLGHTRLQKLHKAIVAPDSEDVDEERNEEVYAELIQFQESTKDPQESFQRVYHYNFLYALNTLSTTMMISRNTWQ